MQIIDRLRAAGFRAVMAGGCVRDMLLSRVPKDYDVATNAMPEQVLRLFPKARKVGAQFGVVLVRAFKQNVEVATFRSDGRYSDGRRPDHVNYGTEVDDAQRRDFTINGLFYDPVTDSVIDLVGGEADLKRKILRTIGDPAARFAEDHLRMLRAVRIAVRLGFSVEPNTADAIRRLADKLDTISRERVWMEIEQILVHPTRAAGWRLLIDLQLRHQFSPDWPADMETDELAGNRLAALPDRMLPASISLAAIACDLSDSQFRRVANSLRLSNKLTSDSLWLIRSLPAVRDRQSMELAELKTLMAAPDWALLLELLRADLAARGRDSFEMQQLLDRAASIPPDRVAPPPLLSGSDLLAMGYQPGPGFGLVLDELYRRQLNEELRSRQEAEALAQQLFGG